MGPLFVIYQNFVAYFDVADVIKNSPMETINSESGQDMENISADVCKITLCDLHLL